MHTFFYWGPLLYLTKISNEHKIEILNLCQKNIDKDFRNNLAANIQEEYLIDNDKFKNLISIYFEEYSSVFNKWYNKKIKSIEIVSTWVNFMKQGEFNPPHTHNNCDLSCVLYLKIPDILKKENEEYIGTCVGGPGSITFGSGIFGNYKYHITQKTHFPEENDFFIFPGSLEHFVFPFKSDCERISVSANFILNLEN
jgi:hypothetical protein